MGHGAMTSRLPNNALQPIVGAVAAGASSNPWALAPPSAERERWAGKNMGYEHKQLDPSPNAASDAWPRADAGSEGRFA